MFKKIITNYFKESDSKTKKLIVLGSEKTNKDFFSYFDDVLSELGVLSIHCELNLGNNKYMPYINFGRDNVFEEPIHIKNLTKSFTTQNNAEELLANEVIRLLHFTNYEKLETRLSQTVLKGEKIL